MRIQRLDAREHGRTRRLYEEVFPEDSRGFVDYYYTEKVKDNIIYVVWEDQDIRAMIHMNPYDVWVNGNIGRAHYIVAVATQKEYRKRGFMAALLKRAIRDCYERREAFTFLMPASEAIYLPYDFQTVYRQNLRYYHQGDEREQGVSIEEAQDEDCLELAKFANEVLLEDCQVFAYRDERYYERLIREYKSEGGKLMVYRKDGGICDIRPFVPQTEQESPGIMARIVDLKKLLGCVRFKGQASVCFRVTDPIIQENNCCLVLSGSEREETRIVCGNERLSEGTLTIAALAGLVFGAKSPEEICGEDGVTMTGRMTGEMGKMIPLSAICLNETV